jgi:hypothetical protein
LRSAVVLALGLQAALSTAATDASASEPASSPAAGKNSGSQMPARPAATDARPPSPGATPEGWAHVWLDLDLPGWATTPQADARERADRRARIMQQQADVMDRLRALGAVETGRVQGLRNAIAVRLPTSVLAEAARLPGVVRVSRVRDIERGPLDRGR